MDVPQYWYFASSLALLVGIINVVSVCLNQHTHMYILMALHLSVVRSWFLSSYDVCKFV